MKIGLILFQFIFFITAAPFLSGLITKIKNNLRMRKGQSVFQPYYNFIKLFSKEEVISETASWIFKVAPFVVLSSSLAAALLIPVFGIPGSLSQIGDFLVLIFVLALGRFFLALAALDTAGSFGGMGSSREMFISSLVEPAACLVIFALALEFGSTNLSAFSGGHPITISSLIAAAALFLITLAETSRIPVDNQETHLELTMIHEAMVLEYSGKRLALVELASYIKQMIWFFLIAQIIFPVSLTGFSNIPELTFWFSWYLARIVIIAVVVGFVEVSVAKMRLFRAVDFLGFAFVLGIIAILCSIRGI